MESAGATSVFLSALLTAVATGLGAVPPSPARELVHLSELPEALVRAESRSPRAAVQGTVARSKEVLLLGIDAREEDRAH